jgi:hypothetical protein
MTTYKMVDLSSKRGTLVDVYADGKLLYSSIDETEAVRHIIRAMTNNDRYEWVVNGKTKAIRTKLELLDEIRSANKYLAEHGNPPYIE